MPGLADDRDELQRRFPYGAVEELSEQVSFALASDEGRCILVGAPGCLRADRPDEPHAQRIGFALHLDGLELPVVDRASGRPVGALAHHDTAMGRHPLQP